MDDDVLKQAMGLIIEGNKKSAGELLAGVVRSDPKNEMAWLYLSYCVELPDQKEYCLRKTLEINPDNQQAKQALIEFGDEKISVIHDEVLNGNATPIYSKEQNPKPIAADKTQLISTLGNTEEKQHF